MPSHDTVDFDPTVASESVPEPTIEEAQMNTQEAEVYAAEVIANVQETSRTVPPHEAAAVAALSEAIHEELGGTARFTHDVEFQTAKAALEDEVYGNAGPERIVNGQQEVSDAEFAAAKRQLEQEVYSQRGGVVAAEEIPVPLTETSSDTLATRMINNTDAAIRSVLPPAVGNLADRAQATIEKGWSSLKGKLSGMWKRSAQPSVIPEEKDQPTPQAPERVIPQTVAVGETTQKDGVSAAIERARASLTPEARARFDAERLEREAVLATKSPEMIELEAQIAELERSLAARSGGSLYQRHDYGIQGTNYTRKAGTAARTGKFMDDAIINQSNAVEQESQQLSLLRNRLLAETLKQGRKNSDAATRLRS